MRIKFYYSRLVEGAIAAAREKMGSEPMPAESRTEAWNAALILATGQRIPEDLEEVTTARLTKSDSRRLASPKPVGGLNDMRAFRKTHVFASHFSAHR